MRRWVVSVVVVGLLAVPLGVLAVTGTGASALERQKFAYTTTASSVTSETYVDVPGLLVEICSDNMVSVDVGLGLSGAQGAVRVVADGETVMYPGALLFGPGTTTGFSFPFVRPLHPFEADDSHEIRVQIRSTSGDPVTVRRGTLIVQYEQGDEGCP